MSDEVPSAIRCLKSNAESIGRPAHYSLIPLAAAIGNIQAELYVTDLQSSPPNTQKFTIMDSGITPTSGYYIWPDFSWLAIDKVLEEHNEVYRTNYQMHPEPPHNQTRILRQRFRFATGVNAPIGEFDGETYLGQTDFSNHTIGGNSPIYYARVYQAGDEIIDQPIFRNQAFKQSLFPQIFLQLNNLAAAIPELFSATEIEKLSWLIKGLGINLDRPPPPFG